MSKHRILLLDDDPEILKALSRVLRKDYDVTSFTEGEEALKALNLNLYSVLITDMRMPNMDGATFLQKAHDISPMSQKILLTGYSDPKDASLAINRGHVDFYINKPWDNAELISMIKVCVENFINEYQQRLINKQIVSQNESLLAQRVELEEQLKQTEEEINNRKVDKVAAGAKVKDLFDRAAYVLMKCIKMHNQDPFAHGDRIATQVKYLCAKFGFTPSIVYQTVMAAKLYELGKMQIPQQELVKSEALRHLDGSRKRWQFIELSADLLASFKEFNGVSTITRHIFENVDGTGGPAGLSGEKVPIPCQLIQICADYDHLVTGRRTGSVVKPALALSQIVEEKKDHISSKVVKAFTSLMTNRAESIEEHIEFALSVDQLSSGMKLAHDLPLEAAKSNYLNKGHTLTKDNIDSLVSIEDNRDSPLILFVYLRAEETALENEEAPSLQEV